MRLLQLDPSRAIAQRDGQGLAELPEFGQIAVAPELAKVGHRVLLRLGPQALASDVASHGRKDGHAQDRRSEHQKVAREERPDPPQELHKPVGLGPPDR